MPELPLQFRHFDPNFSHIINYLYNWEKQNTESLRTLDEEHINGLPNEKYDYQYVFFQMMKFYSYIRIKVTTGRCLSDLLNSNSGSESYYRRATQILKLPNLTKQSLYVYILNYSIYVYICKD